MSKKARYAPAKGHVFAKPYSPAHPEGYDLHDAHETPQIALVVAVGPDTWHEGGVQPFKAPCKVGDVVVHSSGGYEKVILEGEEYRIIPFGRILAVKR